MKAIWYSENGGPDVLQYGEVPDPELAPDTVLIRVEAISIEGGDLIGRSANPPKSERHVPGYQAAGIVAATGSAVTRFRTGDRVVGFDWSGSHAELFAVPEHFAYPVPDGIDIVAAAVVPAAFGTAHDALFTYGDLTAGETVLVQGAAGGVGLAAVQLAAQAGATVIGTAAGADRLARLTGYGLHHGIDYRDGGIAAQCAAITDGNGVDLVVDMAGGAGKEELVAALGHHGRYSVVGVSAGTPPTFGFMELLQKAMRVTGIFLGPEMHTPRVHAMIAELFAKVAAGTIVMPIEEEFALADAAAAHRLCERAHPFGRVVLRP